MWNDGAEWQCGGCTGLTSQWTRLEFLESFDARFVIVTNGPIDEALAYKAKVGNKMDWYSSSESSFGADVDAPPGEGYAVNVFLRDGDTVYRTWHTDGRGTEQLSLHLRADRPAAVGPSGGMAGLPRRLAAVADLVELARLPRHRTRLRPERWWPMTSATAERYVVTRTIAATPAEIFAVLADPTRHKDTEPGDWVRDAIDTDPITGAGQMFAVNMFLEQAGGHYVMHNVVTEFEKDRTIAWLPGQLDEAGKHGPGGWSWRYDLTPNGAGTDVTVTYDWSGTSQEFRDTIGVPVFGEDFIEESLATLDRTVTRR